MAEGGGPRSRQLLWRTVEHRSAQPFPLGGEPPLAQDATATQSKVAYDLGEDDSPHQPVVTTCANRAPLS